MLPTTCLLVFYCVWADFGRVLLPNFDFYHRVESPLLSSKQISLLVFVKVFSLCTIEVILKWTLIWGLTLGVTRLDCNIFSMNSSLIPPLPQLLLPLTPVLAGGKVGLQHVTALWPLIYLLTLHFQEWTRTRLEKKNISFWKLMKVASQEIMSMLTVDFHPQT